MPGWLRSGGVVADFRSDQAAGLRRLFGGGHLQVVTFAAGCAGVGRSLAVANIATSLARLGKEVLVLDENAGSDDVAAGFGQRCRFDLLDVLEQGRRLGEVLVRPLPGLHILPASRAVKKLGRLSLPQQQALLDALCNLDKPLDVILVDACINHPLGFSPFGLAASETVVVLSANTASITEAYALIKKVSHAFARKHFRILVNKVRSFPDARSIFDNISHVASQRHVAELEFAGAIPLDDGVRQAALLGRPVAAVAPDSAAAIAFRDIATDMLYWQQGSGEAGGVEQFVQQLLHLSQRINPSAIRA